MVVLPVRVLDRRGWPLEPDLPQGAFSVYEDGVPQTIRVFAREDLPTSICLAIDHSGSMSYRLDTIAEAALAFVRNSNPGDEICVVNFSQAAHVDADFANDEKSLTAALGRGVIRGDTALSDAISFSIRHLGARARRDRRVLIVVSDGEEVAGSVSAQDLAKEAQLADVAFYAVGFGARSRKSRAELLRVAEATGGHVFFPKQVSDVDGILRRLARDIRRQYTIGYRPSTRAKDGACRSVLVKLSPGSPQATIHTRTAYCAPRK